jgi:thioredoxin reductase (NADPH)
VRMKLGSRAVALSSRLDTHEVQFDDGELVSARSIIIPTGARYNRLPLERLSDFEGVGVYYAATQMEAQACTGRPVVIVGGGNSAGQAALFLARTCTEVHLAIRGQTLASSMSRYLVERIEQAPRIHVMYRTEVTALLGDEALEGLVLRHKSDNATTPTNVPPVRGTIRRRPCATFPRSRASPRLASNRKIFVRRGSGSCSLSMHS